MVTRTRPGIIAAPYRLRAQPSQLCLPETHDGRDLWVVRKGATRAFPGQRGFVGGSWATTPSFVEGVTARKPRLVYSTSRRGRLFGRKQAKRRFARAEMDAWLQSRGVTLVGPISMRARG